MKTKMMVIGTKLLSTGTKTIWTGTKLWSKFILDQKPFLWLDCDITLYILYEDSIQLIYIKK